MAERDVSSARLLGVTVAQYAGIQAAIAEGFPLGEVLANERLTEAKWARARVAWGAKIARDGHGGELAAAFRAKLVEAEAWLGRRVTPLDSDLAAWLAFLGAYAAESSPSTLLARLGLRDEDVTRIGALWKRRTDGDKALAKKAVEINRTQPQAVPRVQITEAKLKPFPWSPGPAKGGAAPARATAAPVELGAPEPPIERPAGAVETPSFLLPKAAPEALSVFAAAAAPASAVPAPVAPHTSGTALVLELPKTVLPFAEPSRSGLSTGTALAFELPVRPATPFTPKDLDTPRGPEIVDAKVPAPPTEKPKPTLSTGTMLPSAEPRGPDLPFSGPATRPERLGERTEEIDLAAIVARVRAQRLGTGATQPEAAPMSPDRPGPATPGPAGPIAPSAPTPAPAPPAPPALTLDQHASLCAELAFRPDLAAEIFARYRVTEAQKRALDEMYLRSEDRRAAWNTAYQAYYQWLSSTGGKRA